MSGPLAGLKVLDIATIIAAPLAATLGLDEDEIERLARKKVI